MNRSQEENHELLESTENKSLWVDWNRILSEYSYLYLVGSISATSLEPILGSLMCCVLTVIFHLQTYPKGRKIFARLWEPKWDLKRQRKGYKRGEKFSEIYLQRNSELKEIETRLGKNTLDSNGLIYLISTIVSLLLLFYNLSVTDLKLIFMGS